MTGQNRHRWSWWAKLATVTLAIILACVVVPSVTIPLDAYPEHVPWWDWVLILPCMEILLIPAGMVVDGSEKSRYIHKQQLGTVFLLAGLVVAGSAIGIANVYNVIEQNESQIFLVNEEIIRPDPVHQWRNYTFPGMAGNDLILWVGGEATAPAGEVATINFTVHIYVTGVLWISRDVQRSNVRSTARYYNFTDFDPATMRNISIELEMRPVATNIDEVISIMVFDDTPYTRIFFTKANFNFHFAFPLAMCIASIVIAGVMCIKMELEYRGDRQRTQEGWLQDSDRKKAILDDIDRWNDRHGHP